MHARLFLLFLSASVVVAPYARAQSEPGTGGQDATAPTEAAEPAAAPVSTANLAPIDPNYLLQVDDVIDVVVFRESDLTTDAIIRKDGRFEMKLLGAVQVAGLTVDQATEAIRSALAADYLVNPRVSLSIVSYAKRKINVLGEVRSPGLYTFPEHGQLFLGDALAMAGGLLPSADSGHITVRRTVDDHEQVLQTDSAGADKFEMRPDDAVSVEIMPKRHFTVLGQINRPGTYDVQDNRPVYLTDAIALAGGFTRLADPSKVLLKRTEAGHETVLELNAKAMANSVSTQRLEIHNEDTITVTESLF